MFSRELRERREKKGLTLRAAAARMAERGGGPSYSMLARYEQGIGLEQMGVGQLRAISRLYRWSAGDMEKKISAETAPARAAKSV